MTHCSALALDPRARVEEFRRKHRTGQVTLVFTDLVASVALRRQLGDQAGTSLLQAHRQLVRLALKPEKSSWIAAKEHSAAQPIRVRLRNRRLDGERKLLTIKLYF